MNLNDAKKRIQAYLCSNKTWPLLVDVQTKSDKSEIIDYFKVGENTFPDIESFCNDDGDLKVDELYAAVSANVGNTFITNVTGFLKLHGELATKRALKTLATEQEAKNFFKYATSEIIRFAFLLTDESLTSLAKKVPDLLDYSDANGIIDYNGDVNDQLYKLFGIDDKNQQYIREVLTSKE